MTKRKIKARTPLVRPEMTAARPRAWPAWAGVALIVVVTCAAYAPVLWAGFIWDDTPLLVNNPLVRSPDGLVRMWSREPIDFWPVTNSTFWIEWRLWGEHPLGYHLVNLLLHVAASLLVWAVLRKLEIRGALWAALLFAVHPVNVEAVAWISQRKTVLAAVFFLLSVLGYLKFDQQESQGRARWYWLSLTAFLLGMLSKASIGMLPLILLLIIWWRRNRVTAQDIVRMAPFFAVAAVLIYVNMRFQAGNSVGMERSVNVAERLAGAGAVIWFYLSKALLPIHLSFLYPQWQIDASDPRWWLPLAAVALVTAGLWWWRNARFGRPLLFSWVYYCLSLVPVLGLTYITFMYYTLVADHYQYLALIGVVGLVGAAICYLRQQLPAELRPMWLGAPAALVGVLAVLTFWQCQIYRDEVSIWQATIARNPDSWIVNYTLGKALADAGQPQAAIAPLEKALAIRPSDPEAHHTLSSALLSADPHRNALAALGHAEITLQTRPHYAQALYNAGSALVFLNRPQEATAYFDRALQEQPDYVEVYANLATALAALNRPAEAVAAAEKAIVLARAQGKEQAARQIETWLTAYRGGR